MFTVTVATKKGSKVGDFPCVNNECYLGKDPDNLIILRGWGISRQHACIYLQDKDVYVRALNKKSPITVSGEAGEHFGPLSQTDMIEIGGYLIQVASNNGGQAESQSTQQTKPNNPTQEEVTTEAPSEHATSIEQPHSASTETITSEDNSNSKEKEYCQWRAIVHQSLIKLLDLRRIDVDEMSDTELRKNSINWITEVISSLESIPTHINKDKLMNQVLNEAVGLGALEELLEDDDISEVMVNAADEIFYEKNGRLIKSEVTFTDDNAVISAIERIVSPLGRRIDESSPMVDARLKDGSRVNAVIPPLALKGPSITIRKFMKQRLDTSDLVRFGSLNEEMAEFLQFAVLQKKNVVISGGTGSGKTTLLNVLSNYIPDGERIVTVEDAAELKLYQPNLVSLEARPPNQEGAGAVSIRHLVKNCLRMRPDRIVVGECRSGEALDMLQAMNTGHDGSLTTLHANSPRDCISRLEVMVMMAGMDLPVLAIREQISSAVDIIVQQTRFPCGSRKITYVAEVNGIENGRLMLSEIFKFSQSGYDANGKVQGYFEATGLIPDFCEDLAKRGIDINLNMFSGANA
ncbi:ATPase, T2SS/T4P/T4SS family [Corallincola platygyrae]|uniref:ATPase, T2SS/T4P/T4SS family n=1 Tax=Corallincola platygyrae TaxID=1193278 RepID=A0ABW4XQE9_9GAMM